MLAALLTGGAAVTLGAQARPAPELGLFGRFTHYSGDIALEDAFGFGARAGYYLSPVLSVEGDASYSTSNAGVLDVSHLPVHLRALLNLPFSDRWSAFLGTGPVLDLYGKDYSLANLGLGTTLGLRLGITPQLMARVGGTWDWVLVTQKDTPSYGNLGFDFGISFFPGRAGGPAASGDEDEDGVPNGADACPGTPPRSAVDARGCVKRADSDNDGVIDINDICPGTPAGAKVDANGCSGSEPKPNPR
jgi:hypothetical protein